jgi:hypothetical protein
MPRPGVTQQHPGAYRDSDPVWALGERWTRDASKRAAATHLDQAEPGGPPGRSTVDDDLVVFAPEPDEPVPWVPELTLGRDLGGGLGIDVQPSALPG